jgi:hypothetical protein
MADIFIAYNKEDQELVYHLSKTLEDEGYSTFYYTRDRKSLQDPYRTSRLEIEYCRLFLFIISDKIKVTKFLNFEIKTAIDNEKDIAVFLIDVTIDKMKNSKKDDCKDWSAILNAMVTINELKRSNIVGYDFSGILNEIKDKIPTNIKITKNKSEKSNSKFVMKFKYFIRYLGTFNNWFRYSVAIAFFLFIFLAFVWILAY